MREFDLHQPTTLSQALTLLASADEQVRPLAGGTDVIVDVRGLRSNPDTLVALSGVEELRGIHQNNGSLHLGASTTASTLLRDPRLSSYTALCEAAAVFANPMIRNLATVAGNLVSASPAGDLLPPLLALDAQVELASASGSRTMRLDEFFIGSRRTARQNNELVTELILPTQRAHTASAFYKLGLRQADAISLVSVAVWLERDGDAIRDVRIALGAVAPRPIRAARAEELLRGQPFTEALARQAGDTAVSECAPIDDLRASAAYRRRMVGVYVRRMLEQAFHAAR